MPTPPIIYHTTDTWAAQRLTSLRKMQHILIIFFNQRINLNRLDQLCLAHRRTNHGCGRVTVDALNDLKAEDTLTHDYETLLFLLYIQSQPFLLPLRLCTLHHSLWGTKDVFFDPRVFCMWGFSMVFGRCALHSSLSQCVVNFSPVLGDLLAFFEFTYSSTESSFIRPLYQISFVEHGRLLDGQHTRREASKPHIMGN